jgi:hypothetical protein
LPRKENAKKIDLALGRLSESLGLVGSGLHLSRMPSEDDSPLLLFLSIFDPYIGVQGKSPVFLDKGCVI